MFMNRMLTVIGLCLSDTDVVDKIARKNPGPHGSVSKNICSNTIWELPNSTIAFPSVSPFISPASGSKSSVHASTCHTTDHEILEIDDEEEMSQTDTPETGLMISNVVSLDGFTHGMENIPPACSKVVEPTNQTLQDHSAVPLTHSNTFVKIRGTFSLFRHKYFSERLFGYCRMCSLKCFSQKEMKAHLLSMHSLDIHYCDVRDYMMVKIFKLRCSFCPEHKRFSCSSPWQMNIHMRIAHSRLSFSKSSNEMNFHTEPKVKFPTKVSKTQPIVVQSMPLESQNGVLFPESSNQMNFPIERENREISEPIVAASLPLDTYESPVLFPDSSNQMNFLIGRDNRKIVNPTQPKVKSSTRVSKTQPVVVQSMRLERESGVLSPKSSNQMNFAIQRDSREISEPIVAESLPLDTYDSPVFFPKSSNQMNFPIQRDNRKIVKPNEPKLKSLTRVSKTQNVVFQSMGLERESGVIFPRSSNQVNSPIERDNREISERIVAASLPLDTYESPVFFPDSSNQMNVHIGRDNREIVIPTEPKVKSSTRVSKTQPVVAQSMRLERESGVLFPKSSNQMNFPIQRDSCEISEPIVAESLPLDTHESRGFFPKSSNQMNFPIERDNRKTVKPNEPKVRSLTRVSETQNVVFQSMELERESGVLFPGLSNQVNFPIERDNREISERIVAESMSLDTNESRVLFSKSSNKMNFSIERDNSEIVNPTEPKVKSSTRVSRTQPTVVESMRLDRQSGVLFPKSSNEMNFPIIRDNCEIVNLTEPKVKSSTRVSKTEPIVVESMRLDTYENGVLTNTQVILGTDKLRDQTDPFQIDDFCDNIPQVSGKSDIEHFAAAIKDKAPVITKNKVSKEDIVDLEDENIDTNDSYGDFESLSNLPLRYRPFVELPKLGDCKKPSQKNTGNVKAVKKITKSKSDSRVSCLLCGISFESIFNLNRHVITHTKSDASVSCLRCGISFQSIVGLKSHLITHTKERPFVCILCNATFQTHQSLTMHTRRSHNKKSKWKYSTRNGCVTRNLANSICVPDNTQHNLFSYHNEKQTSDIILNNSDLIPNIDSDDDDDAWFDTSADYVCNINDITNNEKKAINEGIDSSNAINDTRKHNESHHYVPHNISVHEDDMVDKITLQSTGITNTNRIKNKNIISKEKGSIGNDILSTKCSYCGISFKTVYHLKRHTVIHTNEGPFACTLCNASFQTYSSLNMHTKRIHKRKCKNTNSNGGTSKSSNDNTTSKNTKQKEGEKQSNIISKEKHTNKRAFACALCDTTFPNHQSLSVHKRWTHKYKRKQKHISGFRCIECSMSFKTVLHLNRHIITHTNKRSFACRICDATFQTHQSLSMHKRKIHVCNGKLEGKNSFSCSHCDKSFKSVLYLNRHMVAHTNKRPFVCTSCDTAFQTYQSLARHKRKVHNCKRNLSHINSNGGITRRLLGSITVYDSTAPDDSEPDRHHTPGDDMIEKIYLPSTRINDTKDLKKNVNSRDKFGQGSKCIYCGVFFRTAHHMKRHAVIHTNKGPFTCTLCCASFQTPNSLYMHKRRIHKIEYKRRNRKVATNDDITSKDTEQKGSKKQISIYSEEKPATKSDGLNVVKRLTCIHCGMYFKSKLNLNRHAVIHTNKKPFACALCDATFPNHQSLSVHKRWTHKYKRKPEPISGFRCIQCSMSFKTVLHLNRHMITHSNKKSFACTLCDATFKTHQSRLMHKRNIHEFKRKWQCKNILTCNHCGKSFKSSLCLNRHLVTHTNERPFVCNVCTTTFQTYQSMARHKKMIHNSKKKVQSPNSNITLSKDKTISEEKIDIDKHVLNGDLKSFPCNHCAKSFKSILLLNRHFVTHTSERPFVCKLCDATFQTYQTLARHKREIHRYQRKWQHTYANVGKTKRLIGKINVYNLRTHMDYIPHGHHDHADDMIEKISSPPASINDTKYPKQFKSEKKVNSTDNNNLISKEKTDNIGSDGSNDDSGFPCIHCGIYFISEVNLNRHVVIHTNDRPFTCALCDTTFPTHQSLSIHKRKIHNYKRKIYPYQNKQKRTKDFSCTHCGKSFKSVLCLNRHMVTHTNERPIVCRFCDTTFQTYQSLARHKRMIHRYQRKLQPTNINVDSTRSHVPDKGQENMLSDHNQSEEKQTSSVSLNNSNVTSLKDSNCKVDNDISCDPPVDVDNRPGNKEIHTHEAIESTSLRPHVEPIHEDDNIKKISLQSASITDTNDSNIIETDKKELSEVDISMNEVMKCGLSGAFL